MLGRLNEITYVKHLTQCMACSNCSINVVVPEVRTPYYENIDS